MMQVHNFQNQENFGGAYPEEGTYAGYDQYGQYEEGEYIEGYSGYEDGQYELMPEAMGYNNQAASEDQGSGEYDSRDRDRDRDRRRHRDRRRDRRDKDGRRHRDRDRDRDRDRGRDGRDRRDRDRSAHRSDDDRYDDDGNSNESYARSDRSSDDRGGEKWMTDTPTNTVLLRGMPPYIEEKDIRAELMMCQLPVKDVRLMRRSTGSSRGFAFVEFQSIADAQRWMDRYQGQLMIQNEVVASMHYSTPKSGADKGPIHKMDWTCSKCGVHNFKRRDQCFKCNLSREESERKQECDGFDQVGTNPCNTLVLRGLDALTREDSILTALSQISYANVKHIQIVRDEATNTSRGYGFMELSSVAEATEILDLVTRNPLEVDGKQLLVSYAKNTFTTAIATLAASQAGNYDYSQQSGYYNSTYYQGQEGYSQQSTNTQYYEGQQGYDYSQWSYDQNYQQAGSSTQTDSTNAAAAVAQAAIAQANAAKHSHTHKQKGDKKTEEQKPTQATTAAATAATSSQSSEYPVYPAPDVSTYQYDETSGYYYDPLTTLYYDANSQYYYNSSTQQFLYWDAERSTYLPAPTDVQNAGHMDDGNPDKKKKEEKKEKVKIAKKIAKDMEKWAQTLNKQKDAIKGMKSINIMTAQRREELRESAAADAGYAILEKSAKGGLDDKKLMPPPPLVGGKISSPAQQGGSKPGLVASYGGDSDEEEGGGDEDNSFSGAGGVDESKLTDWANLACLLCKRQFKTREVLIKHQQVSDLHKQNLENLYKSKGLSAPGASGGEGNNLQYRDRAKERREKYGIPPPPEPRRKDRPDIPIPYEEPTKAGIGGDNIGNKMLQKMGWQAGKGLGKKEQGIVNPVEAQRRTQAAGLGMRGANYGTVAGDSYKESLKKTMFARYHEAE